MSIFNRHAQVTAKGWQIQEMLFYNDCPVACLVVVVVVLREGMRV